MPMVSKKLLPLIFIGGAFGTSVRYSIEILLSTMPQGQIMVTSFVNLLGALVLGYVSVHKYFSSSNRQALWGTGFLGGFTTMSGLAMITAGSELGLSSFGAIYWLLVLLQLLIGVAAYRLGSVIAGGVSK